MKTKILTVLIISSLTCFAGGLETLTLPGAKTMSLNGLYFAGHDGINRLLNNPAGLIYIDRSGLEFSILNRLAQNRFESTERGLFKSFRNDEILIAGGAIFSASDDLKLAISYQPASSFNIEWPFAKYFKTDSLSSLLVFDYNNRIISDAISAAAAYRFGILTIGVSPVLYKVHHQLAYPINYPGWVTGTGSAAYQFASDQKGWGFGVNAGMIAEFNPQLKFALSVKSAYSADINGTADSRYFSVTGSNPVKTDVNSTVEFPWVLGFGTVFSPDFQWNFNFDVQYSLWGSIEKSIVQTFSNEIWKNRLSSYDELPGITGNNILLNYKNSLDFGVGIEYVSSETFTYSFGYRYSQTNNSDESYSMLFPSIDQHWLNVGFGLREESLQFEGTLSYGIGISKDIKKTGNNTAGEYGYNAVIPAITLKYFIK